MVAFLILNKGMKNCCGDIEWCRVHSITIKTRRRRLLFFFLLHFRDCMQLQCACKVISSARHRDWPFARQSTITCVSHDVATTVSVFAPSSRVYRNTNSMRSTPNERRIFVSSTRVDTPSNCAISLKCDTQLRPADISTSFRTPSVMSTSLVCCTVQSSASMVRSIQPERPMDFLHKNQLFIAMSLTFLHGKNSVKPCMTWLRERARASAFGSFQVLCACERVLRFFYLNRVKWPNHFECASNTRSTMTANETKERNQELNDHSCRLFLLKKNIYNISLSPHCHCSATHSIRKYLKMFSFSFVYLFGSFFIPHQTIVVEMNISRRVSL